MADSQVSYSSVNPSDSVSNATQKKKNRPGKNQRQKANSGSPSSSSANMSGSSVPNARAFSSGVSSAPVPQPGKFPVVFAVGAGEPTTDKYMSVNPKTVHAISKDLGDKYIYSPKYAEFSDHAGIDDDEFRVQVVRQFLLGVAQHIVYSHVNMGLPQGDFSSVASTETYLFASLRSVLSQFGEFVIEALGTRYLYADYATTVSSLVFAAERIREGDIDAPLLRSWLPMTRNDKRTKHLVACALSALFREKGVRLDVDELTPYIFKEMSPTYDAVKGVLGLENNELFDFLFKGYTDEASFAGLFTGDDPAIALALLGLSWPSPSAGHLDFSFLPKVSFPQQVEPWALKRAAVVKFFSCGVGTASRSVAHGSPAQLSSVKTQNGVTVVRSRVAVSAPEFSLLACFPFSALESDPDHGVVLTTSIAVSVRAIEFSQLDWL
jgi:hypothetical protein